MEHWISKAIIHNLEVENPTNHENYKVLVKTLNKIRVYIRTIRNWEVKKVGKGWNNKIAYILGPKRRSIDRSGSKQAAIASAKQKHNWKTRVSDNYYEEGVDETPTCVPDWWKTHDLRREREWEIEQDRVLEGRGKWERVKILKLILCCVRIRRSQFTRDDDDSRCCFFLFF